MYNEKTETCEGIVGRRERLQGNRIAEDVSERSRTFIESRLNGHSGVGEKIQKFCVSELGPWFRDATTSTENDELTNDNNSNPNSLSIRSESIPESVLEHVRKFYNSILLLAEDASNAAAYLFAMQPRFPEFFHPAKPFTPTEQLLLTGNLALPTFPLRLPALVPDLQPSNDSHAPLEVVGLAGLPGFPLEDHRSCELCGLQGDHAVAGRLLCTPTGEWVHLNCVYYSTGVSVDEKNGCFQKYTQIRSHSRTTHCYICNRPGASLHCCFQGCTRSFHFVCGFESHCFIRINKEAFCLRHQPRDRSGSDASEAPPPRASFFSSAALPSSPPRPFHSLPTPSASTRPPPEPRVTVSSARLFTCRFNYRVVFSSLKPRDGRQLAASRTPPAASLRFGALTVTHVGTVLPSPFFHDATHLFPDLYRAFRIFWSTRHPAQVGVRPLFSAAHAVLPRDPQRPAERPRSQQPAPALRAGRPAGADRALQRLRPRECV